MSLVFTKGTQFTAGSEVGDDIDLSSESIADGAGRWSASGDLDSLIAASRTPYIHVWAHCQWQATPTLGEVLRWVLATSLDNTLWTHDDGTGDGAISAEDKLFNQKILGNVRCDQAAANIPTARDLGIHEIVARRIQVGMWNDGGAAIAADVAETKLLFDPVLFADS